MPFYVGIVLTIRVRLLDTYGGYFGGLTCLAWSPDGKYVVVCAALLKMR
jgi:hypothetical protein